MNTRRRVLRVLVVLAAAQLGAVLVYRAFERGEAEIDFERFSDAHALPALVVERRGGERTPIGGGPLLLHVWASWCVPCRDELPALLRAADDGRLEASVIAVSVDESWDVIAHFTDPSDATLARLDHDTAKRALNLGPLPQTFVVDKDGVVVGRFRGAQPWESEAMRAAVRAALERAEAAR